MKVLGNLSLCLLAGALLAMPAHAATAAKKPAAKIAAKAVAVVEPQPDPAQLILQAHDAQARGETELALRLAQAAIVADPARPSAYDALADVYAANKDTEAARSYYGEALSIDPADQGALTGMAALGRETNQAQAEGTPPVDLCSDASPVRVCAAQ